MLKNVIEFVQSRTDIKDRDAILREINMAWAGLWMKQELPNSTQEITLRFDDPQYGVVVLPYFIAEVRGIKLGDCVKVKLKTPRSNYQTNAYMQSPYSHVVLGTTPLSRSISNASTVTFKITEAEIEPLRITCMGPTDNAAQDREQITIPAGSLSATCRKRFTDFESITKSLLTKSNLTVVDANGTEIAMIPNNYFEVRCQIIQVSDKCNVVTTDKCFDYLYKTMPPLLYYDEQALPANYEEILGSETVKIILLPTDNNDSQISRMAGRAEDLQISFNQSKEEGKTMSVDMGNSRWESNYYGYL